MEWTHRPPAHPTEPDNRESSTPRRLHLVTVAAACSALFVIFLDNTVVNVALPTIQRQLATSTGELEWAVNVYVVAFASLVVLAGTVGDALGRRRLFIAGLLLFGAASALAAASTGPVQLIAARGLQGLGAALLAPMSLSLLTAVFPRDRLPVAVGLWAGISGLGLAVGPLVGGLLVVHAGWRAIFWINVPLCLLALLFTLSGIEEVAGVRRAASDVRGALLLTSGLSSLTAGLTHAVRHPWSNPWTVGLVSGSICLLVSFAVQQRRNRNPLIPLSWWKDASIRAAIAVLSMASFALFGTLWFLTLYLQNVRGYGAVQAGIRTLPLTLTTLCVAPVVGKVVARRGPYGALVAGMMLTSLATFDLTRLTVDTAYWHLALTLGVLGTGLAIVMPTTVSCVLARVHPDQASTAAGLVIMSRQCGGAIGLALLATIGARLASSQFTQQTGLRGLDSAVAVGQTQGLRDALGRSVHDAGAASFLHGFSVAMWIATVVSLAAGILVGFGLRAYRPADPTEDDPALARTLPREAAGSQRGTRP